MNSVINNDLDKNAVKDKMRQLISKIRYYDHLYYIKNQSIITDTDYDLLREELEALERQYPDLVEVDSPTQNINYMINDDLVTREHNSPMLSLRNTYSIDEVERFLDKEKLWPVVLEPKLDGISLSLHYKDSYLLYALLRGDGVKGEDVTNHVINIQSIPLKLNKEGLNLEIRGELCITKQNFQKLNIYKEKKGEKPFQNSRNATGGIIRYKGNDRLLYTYLSFVPYTILQTRTIVNQHSKFMPHFCEEQRISLCFLKELGFIEAPYFICNNKEEIERNISLIIDQYSYIQDMDGVVIKTNNLIKMDELGYTNRHPLGAIAYKFTNQVKETEILSLKWQVSRNGKIVPVGDLKPIFLDNANISKITLHSKSYLQENLVGVGAKILIERVGSAVPQIKKVLSVSEKGIYLQQCPCCGNTIEEDKSNYFCKNHNCKDQIEGRLYYFVQTLQLKGLGEKSISEISKYVSTPSQLINFIRKTKTMNISGWDKFRFNVNEMMRKIDAVSLLISLGIENMSYQGISILLSAIKITTLKDINYFLDQVDWEAKVMNLIVPRIGKEKMNSFVQFLKNNKEEIQRIIKEIQVYNEI